MTCKNRYLLYLLAATLMLTACSGVEEGDALDNSQMAESQAVAFNAYVNRGITRGGKPGVVTNDALKTGTHATDGFGVMAYYTESRRYNQMALPNFMYNQQVTWQTASLPASWTYTPVKYWPNETGSNGSSKTDYLSFFAYAPYIEVDPATGCDTGSGKTGIMSLSRPTDNGDPFVRYSVSLKPAEAVDLCWATPHIDQTKPTVNTTVNLDFHHALASLNVQIDADVDVAGHPSGELDSYTRIWVRSITFRGFAERGQLNLNNASVTPHWNNLDCDCDLSSDPITIYDGRRDDREGASASLNELRTGLNPIIVQSGRYTVTPGSPETLSSTTAGVTNTTINLFDVSDWASDPANPTAEELAAHPAAPIYVIPTNEDLYVTIVYDVETYDPKLTSQYLSDGRTHGSTIENSISAYITNGTTPIVMEAGKQYTLNLHLGVASVKMNASVTPWADEIGNVDVNVPE